MNDKNGISDLSHVTPTIRCFFDRDLDQMKRIERASYIDNFWLPEDFTFFLRRIAKDHEAYIAEWREHILGFMLVIRSTWSYEIVSVAVQPEFRRIKVGQQLVDYLKSKLIPYGREDIYANVRQSNKRGQEFFSEIGFKPIEFVTDADDKELRVKMKFELEALPLKAEHENL